MSEEFHANRAESNRSIVVQLSGSAKQADGDILLWYIIQKSSEALSFEKYQAYLDAFLCGTGNDAATGGKFADLKSRRYLPFIDTDAYRALKVATEAFLTVNCAIPLDEQKFEDTEVNALLQRLQANLTGTSGDELWKQYLKIINGTKEPQELTLPYLAVIRRKLADSPIVDKLFGHLSSASSDDARQNSDVRNEAECYGILLEKLSAPCFVELIWSYWHEEGMLVQTMNAISRRFQNMRGHADRDPLAMLEISPLRPLNNLLWGYIQDEQHRLSLVRRAYEYDHHYGFTLEGKALPQIRPADSRSRFLETFHNLLGLVTLFYKQDDDNTVNADAFPILKALEDLHLLLSEGAHNQFGDLPMTARVEMMMQQWLLARPEFREVLPRRTMVAYPETWMDSVDAMKRLQGWTDTSVLHFRHLAVYGERILLSIRFGDWSNTNSSDRAALWARFFRNDIQGYIHAYRTVTGVDLSADASNSQQQEMITISPSVLLRKRSLSGRSAVAMPAATSNPQLVFTNEQRAVRQR